MPYFSKEDIREAREMDLLTYLRNYEPHELVRVSGETYCTREHDSLKISNGMWNWFSRGIGGRTALDYLMIVQGYDAASEQAFFGKRICAPRQSAWKPE